MRFSNPFVPLMLRMQGIKCGKKCRFSGLPVIIKKHATIKIGNRLTLASALFSNLVGLYQRSIIVARNGASIVIGDNVSMSGVTIYSFKRIVIGSNVLIGANAKILDSDFHPVDPVARLRDPDDKTHTVMKEIVIGDNVFIGCNTLILKGVHIGENAIVGAGSVVTKDVPANTVVAGNPAVVVKRMD